MTNGSDDRTDLRRTGIGRPRRIGRLVFTAFALFAVVTGLAVAAFPDLIDALMLFDVQSAVSWYRDLGGWGLLGSIAMMTVCALTFAPAEVVAMANGMTYGPVWGSLLTWVGGMVGANLGFAFARAIGPGTIRRLIGPARYQRVADWSNSRGSIALLAARCIPFLPFFALNLGAGAVGMRWWTYNWSTAIGIVPAAVIFTVLGDRALHWPVYVWLGLAAAVVAALFALRRLVDRAQGSA